MNGQQADITLGREQRLALAGPVLAEVLTEQVMWLVWLL